MDDTYKLVLWPEVQVYMSEDWFQSEACPAPYDYIQEAQAYFIPINYITS
jgi:hypothetical protein